MTEHPGPLVSVVLPTHNRAALLRRAMQSVLAQSYRNIELIVVDDASSDHTPDVVASMAADRRLHYIRLPENRRAAAARNIGINRAKGELVAFQDDDDVWLVEKLTRQVAALRQAGEDIGLNLCGHIRHSPHQAVYIGGHDVFARLDFANGPLIGFGLIATPSWLVRKHCLEKAGLFDERMKTWDDWELALRLSDVCRFAHLDEPLFIQDRLAGGSMWSNHKVYAHDMQLIMNKHGSRWADRPRTLSRNYMIIGRYEATFHSLHAGRRWLLKSVRANPLNLKAWSVLGLSLFGQRLLERISTALRIVKPGRSRLAGPR